MGVGSLQAFMERHCPGSIRKVSLQQITKTFKEKNPSVAEPILVIDGNNCMYDLYSGLDWLCGGQWLEFIQVLQNFIQALQNLGLKPVFFFDGSTPIFKREVWYKRRMKHLEDTVTIYNLLKAKLCVPESLFQLPASMSTLIRLAVKYVCKVPVYTVINGDCDQIVATFAKRNNCVAILTQDSDFVIYNTVPFISMKKLNLKTMETVVYDREMFCARMNITIAQLPLLACLMGNDYVSRDSLTNFHRQIVHQYTYSFERAQEYSSYNIKILANVIQFIKRLQLRADAFDLESRLPTICLSVFGTTSQMVTLRNGLQLYQLNYSECQLYRNPFEPHPPADYDMSTLEGICNYVLEKSVNVDISELLYNTMINGRCEVDPALEDERNLSFSPSVMIYRPIRSRLYDLIFAFRDKHIESWVSKRYTGVRPASKVYIEELWANSIRLSLTPEQVHRSEVRVNGEIPDLLKLWTSTEPSTVQLKWKTIQSCLNLSQSPKCLEQIQDKFKLPIMLLNYLIQSPNVPLESWEVDAFLVQCVLPKAFDIDWIKNLKITSYDHHAVHLAALFYRGTTQFYTVLTLCGEPYPVEKSLPWHYFDGKRFHHCYAALKSGTTVEDLCSNDAGSLTQFRLLKKATYENLT